MSFSIDSFNRTIKNRAIRTSNKEGFKSNNRDVSKSSSKKTMLNFKKVSEEELEIIKLNIRKKAKRDRIQLITIVLVLTIIALFGIYKLIF